MPAALCGYPAKEQECQKPQSQQRVYCVPTCSVCFPPALKSEAAVVFAVDGECEQRTLVHCCEVAGALIFVAVVLLDQLQRFAQLQHGRKFVLAVVAAEAGAKQLADLTAAVSPIAAA